MLLATCFLAKNAFYDPLSNLSNTTNRGDAFEFDLICPMGGILDLNDRFFTNRGLVRLSLVRRDFRRLTYFIGAN